MGVMNFSKTDLISARESAEAKNGNVIRGRETSATARERLRVFMPPQYTGEIRDTHLETYVDVDKSGTSTTKRDPLPAPSDSARIVPLCASMICLAMKSP